MRQKDGTCKLYENELIELLNLLTIRRVYCNPFGFVNGDLVSHSEGNMHIARWIYGLYKIVLDPCRIEETQVISSIETHGWAMPLLSGNVSTATWKASMPNNKNRINRKYSAGHAATTGKETV